MKLPASSFLSASHETRVLELLTVMLFLTVLSAQAQLTTDALKYNFDANGDQTLSDGWESLVNSGERDFTFAGTTRVLTGNEGATAPTNPDINAGADLHGLAGRLDFRRLSAFDSRDRSWAESYGLNVGGDPNPSTADASWEFWFKLDQNDVSQLLWESGGGGDGSSFRIDGADGKLKWIIKDAGVSDVVVLPTATPLATGVYHHVVGVYDRDGAAGNVDLMTLYLNGVATSGTNTFDALNDWAGSDDTSLGGRSSGVGGTGGALGNIDSGSQNLNGQIAAFRFYEKALSQAEVDANIGAVQAENVYFDDGGGSTEWSDSANWDTNLVSGVNQNTIINAGQTATIEAGTQARSQTLFVGADGGSSLPGYVTDGTPPADGDGTVTMTGGQLDATQIVLGNAGNSGTFNFVDGVIRVNTNGDKAINDQAFHVGYSNSQMGTLTMGTAGGGTSPDLLINGGRFEIGDNNADGLFTMESGTFRVNNNFIVGQSGDTKTATFQMNGGDVWVNNDMNLNDGTSVVNQTGGTVRVSSLQTMGSGNNTDTITLSGGEFTIANNLVDRGGTTNFTINGGRLNLDRATVGGQHLREIENLDFSSGVIEFSISDSTIGTTALRIGSDEDSNGIGNFAGTGQIDVELDNLGGTTATTTTWSGGNGVWTAVNDLEWDNDNPIQYLNSGTAYDVIIPHSAGTSISGLGDLTSANPDFDLNVKTTFNPSDTLEIVANKDIGMTPIKAIIDTAGTVTRNADLKIDGSVGADAAALDINNGTLDLGTAGVDLIIGGTTNTTVTQNGGAVTVRNVIFGAGPNTQGGILQLNGGTFSASGNFVENDTSIPNAQLYIDGGALSVGGNISVERFAIGQNAGTTGEYTTKGGRTITSSELTVVGANGTGTLDITGGATLNANTGFRLGDGATGIGTVNQNGGDVNTTLLIIGNSGSGTYNLNDGSITATAGLRLANVDVGTAVGVFNMGDMEGAFNPTVTVSGGNFEVAQSQTGTFNLMSGSVFQASGNLITGQGANSVANATIGGGAGQATYTTAVNSDWNINSGDGFVDILQNGLVSVGRNLNLGSNGAEGGLDLDINGGELRVGALNAGGDLSYRAGGPNDFIKVTNGKLSVADDFFFNDNVGKFQVNGSGNAIAIGDRYFQETGNTNRLIVAPDALGLSAIEVGGTAEVAGTLDVDESLLTATALPNSATTKTAGGAWDGTDTGWNLGNPMGQQITVGERIVVINAAGGVTDLGLVLDPGDAANWALDLTDPNQVALIANTTSNPAAVHAILCASTTTTRASDLLIDASGNPAADAAGLTIDAADTLQMDNGSTLTVQGGARLAGEGKVDTLSGGSTIIAAGGILDPGATATGLPGGASLAGSIEFDGDLTSLAGSTWNIDLVDPSLAIGVGADFVDVSGQLTIGPGVTLNFAGFRPDLGSVYTIAEYGMLSGTFAKLGNQAVLNGYQIDYGAGFGGTGSGFITLTAVVPEPSTILALFGMVVGTFFRRRRRRLLVAGE